MLDAVARSSRISTFTSGFNARSRAAPRAPSTRRCRPSRRAAGDAGCSPRRRRRRPRRCDRLPRPRGIAGPARRDRRADHQHRAVLQPCLAFASDLRQRHLAGSPAHRARSRGCVRVRVTVRARARVRVRVPPAARSAAVDPTRVAVDVMFLLPDRDAVLDLVDDVAARGERLGPVRRAHTDPDGHLAERKVADAVHAGGPAHAVLLDGFGNDALALAHGERGEGFVLQSPDLPALVVITHPALEARVAPQDGSASAARPASVSNGTVLNENACISPPRPAG